MTSQMFFTFTLLFFLFIGRSQAVRFLSASMCSALTGCSLNCPNGRVHDANGCETCQCRVCSPVDCGLEICFYGNLRDSDGCMTCGCNNPCRGISCTQSQTCHVVQTDASGTFSGRCVALFVVPLPKSCSFFDCTKQCQPFGFKRDVYGCTMCDCWDPCEGNLCKANERCIIDPCALTKTCRNYGYYCLANDQPGRTVYPITTQAPEIPKELRLEMVMHKCCATVVLSSSCLATCMTDSRRLLSDYRSCFSARNIWEYLRCFSVSQANATIADEYWKPPLGMFGFASINLNRQR